MQQRAGLRAGGTLDPGRDSEVGCGGNVGVAWQIESSGQYRGTCVREAARVVAPLRIETGRPSNP